MNILFCVLACLLGTKHFASALPTVSVTGSKFFDSDGNQFFVKGVAYQLTPDDPLVDAKQCQLDASLMKELGANAIRVYHVDPDQDHDGCMTAFAEQGIYLFLDLDTFTTWITPQQPTFNETQYAAFARVLDNFQQYDNLAGVFVGNEVLTQPANVPAAPYVKAAATLIKAYRDQQQYRNIPVGYSAADIATLRPMLQDYLVCGANESESIDFFGLNAYEWCGSAADYQTSGYAALQKMASGYPRPIFFSETGCNTARPRTWADQAAIFGPDMSGTWSGAIAYEWIEEENDYGLIQYGAVQAGNMVRSGSPTPISPDFQNLKTAWAKVSPSSVALSDYTASLGDISTPQCPASTADAWPLDGNVALPLDNTAPTPRSVPTMVNTVDLLTANQSPASSPVTTTVSTPAASSATKISKSAATNPAATDPAATTTSAKSEGSRTHALNLRLALDLFGVFTEDSSLPWAAAKTLFTLTFGMTLAVFCVS